MPRSHRSGIRAAIALTLGLVAAGALTVADTAQAARPGISRVQANGLIGHVGIDLAGGGSMYESYHYWDAAGNVSLPDVGSPDWVRLEFYPNSHDYDPWTLSVGGVHVERTRAEGWSNLGEIPLPIEGQTVAGHTAARMDGKILSSTAVPDGRLSIDAFQISTVYPDLDVPQPPVTAWGVEVSSFASGKNKGNKWTAGVAWPGRYIVFVNDSVTGTRVQAMVDLAPGKVPTIDLDAICYGFDTCQYNAGGPTTTAGKFHPTSPTRILDTRFGTGITNGPVRSGGGRADTPDPLTRRDEIANHTLKVTGVAGVPEAGVSAVLLNVTAVAPPGEGYLSVVPKSAHCCGGLAIFDDQGALLPGEPTASNLNVVAGDVVPNLVLARVGAGGKIQIYNWWGPTHVAADIAGWFGTGGAYTDGSGFAGVTPTRVLDTRNGVGGAASPFSVNETRSIQVAGVAGVPANAKPVVVNITAVHMPGSGYLTAFPDGTALPNASNLNYKAGDVRSNLAVVQVGANGKIAINTAETGADVIVDVLGSFGPYGGKTTAIDPVRLVDSRGGLRIAARPMNEAEVARIPVRGEAGIPATATAVMLNVTAVNPQGFGFFTLYPTAGAVPTSSNVNFGGGRNVPNMVMVKLGADGSISLFNGVNRSDVIIDVLGYVI